LRHGVEGRSEMCCTRVAENTGRKNNTKNCHLRTIAQVYLAISLQLKHVWTVGKTVVKQRHLPHMSSQCGKLPPTNGLGWLESLSHPCKFQRVSRLRIVTAQT